MSKIKKTLLIVLAITIVILAGFLIKKLLTKNNNSSDDKVISEVKYLDNELTSLLNSVNNISLENYKISIIKTSTDSNLENQEESSQNSSSQNDSSESDNSTSSSSESSSSNQSSSNTTASEQYGLEETGILTSSLDPNWDTIKNEIERIYSIIPTVTLDLYNIDVNQNDILNFNKELDELTIAIKEEDKTKVLSKLASLYEYLPIYVKNFSEDNKIYNIVLETKSNIFYAYALLDTDDWQGVSNYLSKAIESYSSIITDIDLTDKDYVTNSIYILLNELKNAVDLQDKEIFLIKYKDFLEEIERVE